MMNKIRKLKKKKGFTLVELIVVIAIIAILTAVIVPLVGRYAAQATYTTLQDTAKTISNSCKNVISDVTMMGKTFNTSPVTGRKSSGTLTVTIGSTSKTAADAATLTSSSSVDERVAAKLAESLQEALTANDCQFYIEISSNTVSGVIYESGTSLTLVASKDSDLSITKLKNYESAYKFGGASGTDIGIDGSYTAKATDET